MRRKGDAGRRGRLLVTPLLLVAATALAAPAGGARSDLRAPSGPVRITADRADLERRELALYRGNVKMTSAELELSGDRLELRQPARGEIQVVLTGSPARLLHKGAEDVPPIAARAPRIVYDTRTARVEMTGGVQLERGSDTVASEAIRYDLAARRISATGSDGKPVQILIEPPAGMAETPAAPPTPSGTRP